MGVSFARDSDLGGQCFHRRVPVGVLCGARGSSVGFRSVSEHPHPTVCGA